MWSTISLRRIYNKLAIINNIYLVLTVPVATLIINLYFSLVLPAGSRTGYCKHVLITIKMNSNWLDHSTILGTRMARLVLCVGIRLLINTPKPLWSSSLNKCAEKMYLLILPIVNIYHCHLYVLIFRRCIPFTEYLFDCLISATRITT